VRTALFAAVGVLGASAPARAVEPWVDADPPAPPERYEIGAVGIRAEAEYRAQYTVIHPILLNSEDQRRANWIEHRGRFGGTVDYDDAVAIVLSADLLDGVLWGDNGTFTREPEPNAGVNATARNPNLARQCVAYLGEGDQLQPSSYGLSLCDAEVLKLRRLYGQVRTPVGVLRIGRQPVSVGMGVQTTTGDGRQNRFGVSGSGDYVDRALFATKPLEAFKPKEQRNHSEHEGLVVALMYDRWVSDSLTSFSDDLHGVALALRFGEPELGALVRDLELLGYLAHRWSPAFETAVNVIGTRAAVRVGDVHAGLDLVTNFGTTREVSDAYSLISNDPILEQDVRQLGTRAVVRFDQPHWTAYFELDYASGDGDPQVTTPLTQFRFSEDTNVGLLLFEHVVRLQSARAAAAGVELLRRLGSDTFPSERIDTRGAFTDAFAIFPQLDVRPIDTLLLRAGVLVAWAPEGLIDPVGTLRAKDGLGIEDDLVNFVGGKPGNFYGVELDGRFQWRFLDHFAFDLEGAVLFPGDALEDANGEAANSFLVQARTTFYL
jgi:hypothetical protein